MNYIRRFFWRVSFRDRKLFYSAGAFCKEIVNIGSLAVQALAR